MPPAPKPKAQRRRRNATPGSAVLDPSVKVKVPTLPGAKGMLASTRSYWRRLWSSPMAQLWLDADVPALVRLTQLHDLTTRQFQVVAEGPVPRLDLTDLPEEITVIFDSPVTAAHLAEMRQLEDRLGLSPLSRRRHGWEIAEPDDDDGAAADREDELETRRLARFAKAAGE